MHSRRLAAPGACLTEDEMLAFVEGCLTGRDIRRVDHHIGACSLCGALAIEALSACRGFVAANAFDTRCWAFEPGECIANRYVIRSPLGQGGMGDVYEVLDLASQHVLALKTGKATSGDCPKAARRLAREASFARRARHPNVCAVYEDGVLEVSSPRRAHHGFMTMQLIEGQTLAERLRAGRLSCEEAIGVARELFSGVAAVHRAGIVHRDIKSQNFMLSTRPSDPCSCLIDFGLAIDANQARAQRHDDVSASFEGSPAYMAPEQFQDRATPATDVFGCGAVLFEALTGSLAFRSFRNGDTGAQRDPTEAPRRISELVSGVPHALELFVARCLALDPALRFDDAGAALCELDRTSCGSCFR